MDKTEMKPIFRLTFALLLFAQTRIHAQEIPCAWSNVERIVAVGDVHADGDQLIACLRAGGVIDEQEKWIGGKTHLVQLGDLVDPAPGLKMVMDLLMALEVQAQEAGGRVHVLLGNHELMILNDNHDDPNAADVASFGALDEYKKAMRADGKYGKWIRSRNAVIRINDLLFVHGGLSSGYAAMSLEEINKGVRAAMDNNPGPSNMAHDPQGPLWFRGLALEGDPKKLGGMLASILRAYGVKHMVVGHTITQTRQIVAKAGGALILTDVGMSDTYGRGPAMCLVIEGKTFSSVTSTKRQNLRVE